MIRTYRDIRYTLKRSDRKTASIYVERDGQVTVTGAFDPGRGCVSPPGFRAANVGTVVNGPCS
jgi:hypothetical protein